MKKKVLELYKENVSDNKTIIFRKYTKNKLTSYSDLSNLLKLQFSRRSHIQYVKILNQQAELAFLPFRPRTGAFSGELRGRAKKKKTVARAIFGS